MNKIEKIEKNVVSRLFADNFKFEINRNFRHRYMFKIDEYMTIGHNSDKIYEEIKKILLSNQIHNVLYIKNFWLKNEKDKTKNKYLVNFCI